ncbi:MAG: M28 family peptidase [Candidatus Thorarchaeota archaeon]|nr:MAG: M28 family peptidase [Candidatus Thorarchaeota archaeon]
MNVEKTSIDEIRKTVEYLCDLGQKVAGTEPEVQAANYLHERLREFGFTHVEMQSFDVHGWYPLSSSVRITQPIQKEIESALFPHCKSEEVEGRLVAFKKDADPTLSRKGLIAYSEWGPDPYLSPRRTYYHAVRQGYDGLIVAAPDKGDFLKVVVLAIGGLLEIPVVCITKEEGDSLSSLIESEEVSVNIKTEIETSDQSQSYNVMATLEGDGTAEHEVIVGAHYDSWFQGAGDNCAPAATVLELARLFGRQAQAGRPPRRTIRFLFYGAEESGTNDFYFWLNGSKAFVKSNPEIVARTAAVLSLDSTGYTSPAKDYIYATADVFEFAKSIQVELEPTLEFQYLDPPSYGSDHWFFELSGIPTIYGVAFPSPLYHTQKDDPDHLDFHAVHYYAEYMKEALSYLSEVELLPIDIFLPLKRFEQIFKKYQKLDENPFDFSPILAKLRVLMKQESSTRRLLKAASKSSNPDTISELNQFLLRTANKYNQTIGWITRPHETYASNYLCRLEMIEDIIHLTNSVKNLRNIPISNFMSERAALYDSQSDNAYNWIRIHEPLARIEEECTRIRREIEEELKMLSSMIDSISEDIAGLTEEQVSSH